MTQFEHDQDVLAARDHRKLGRELDLFALDPEVGKGLPLWLPNGTVIREELEKLAKEFEFEAGYQRVATPHLARVELYHRSGHLPYFAEHMYPVMEVKEWDEGEEGETETKDAYVLRPMNCPHHHRIFAARPRSYRDLPIRLAEYGQVYRWEDSGAVSGLMRARGMCMNDGHIYCAEHQVKEELLAVMAMYLAVYRLFGIDDYFLRLSRHDAEDPKGKEKYVDNPTAWAHAERVLAEVLTELGLEYTDGLGHAAFYGPKIDIQFQTLAGRDETVSTIQLDFVQPERLGLTYVGADGQEHTPYCIHRAPFSTHERFIAFLTEHFAGAFPTWLAPVQVQVTTVSDQFNDYASNVVNRLREKFVRAELAPLGDTVPKKIREATIRKIPNILIVGEREKTDSTVTLRRYGIREQVTLSIEAFEHALLRTIRERSLTFLID